MTEIAFWIWLNDVKGILDIDVEYSPDIKLEYAHHGKTHFYMPDFRIGNQLFELKGDHFFDGNGKMTCPHRNPDWNDAKHAEMCDLYEAKHQCMKANGVHVLRTSVCKFFIDYVRKTYGRDYLKQFKPSR